MQTTGLSEKLSKLLERQHEDEREQLVYNNGQLPGQPQGYSPQPYIQQPYGYGGHDMMNHQREQPPLSYYGQEDQQTRITPTNQNPNAANWATFTSFVDSEYQHSTRLHRINISLVVHSQAGYTVRATRLHSRSQTCLHLAKAANLPSMPNPSFPKRLPHHQRGVE